ncbi:hypothetical protein RYH80_12515 [Halobaculum sp. MBLA0147]|uniref:hypothetical protein n=1 Tax=Halobaculum sp. MBLA0147 TaxID=3079934 RepID=UPI003526A27D
MSEDNDPTRRDVVKQTTGAAVGGLALAAGSGSGAAADGEVTMETVRDALETHGTGLIGYLESEGLVESLDELGTPRRASAPGGPTHLTAETESDGRRLSVHVDPREGDAYAVTYRDDDSVEIHRAGQDVETVPYRADHQLNCACQRDMECRIRNGQNYCCRNVDCWYGRCCF